MRVARPPGLAAGYALRDAWLACAGLHPNKKPRDNWTFEPEEEERIDLSAGIAWFGDILNIEGPLVEIGSRSVFGNSALGVRH